MAEGKNKIVVYADWLNNFEELTDEELGKLMRHFFMYVNDMNPVLEDRLLKIAWKPMESTLKRDLKKWETFVDKQKANGKKGGRPKTQKTQAFKEKPKKAVSDSVSVSDSDIINNIYNKFVDEVKNGNHSQAIDMIYMKLKIKKGSLTPLLKEFKGQLVIDQTIHKNTLELRKHFHNWLNTQERVGKLDQYKIKT